VPDTADVVSFDETRFLVLSEHRYFFLRGVSDFFGDYRLLVVGEGSPFRIKKECWQGIESSAHGLAPFRRSVAAVNRSLSENKDSKVKK